LLAPDARHTTITQQRSNIVSLLLHKHADPHVVSSAGFTPFHIAVLRDSLPLLRQLLTFSSGLGKSRYLPDRVPLLSYAVLNSSPECFKKTTSSYTRSSWPGQTGLYASHCPSTA
jgi:ankyrin repeat protein